MVDKTLISFPIFAPPLPSPNHRPSTAVGFSRWNNANAEKFNREKRIQKEIEDQIRFVKRHNAALNIVNNHDNPTPPITGNFKSIGTPSSPSKPSIPGRKSKYSKPPPKKSVSDSEPKHPAFKPVVRVRKIPDVYSDPDDNKVSRIPDDDEIRTSVNVDENGVSYEFPGAPFVYQYSYTETPKVKPLKLREPLVMPFETKTMPRPWTGRKPLPPSKKKLPEFDSFRLPPPHKKGVKPVQAPGPFLAGSGPKYAVSREDVLGEPLTKEEIEELVNRCKKTQRQLNMGRDGLTHNMIENIHAHWKRKRVCKIKCKGVCTVDMDNVREKLEEKTGGKIIYSRGGVIYLFRGRNYNYRTRPRMPLMLWRPVTPVYPRLIQRVPEGLTLEEATEMRKRGRNLLPICKLAKNGVYNTLVRDVRQGFEACDLVRINCQELNPSDYRKIGAKLKDLVPCVLISFQEGHVLMWRGQDWKSSVTEVEDKPSASAAVTEEQRSSTSDIPISSVVDTVSDNLSESTSLVDSEDSHIGRSNDGNEGLGDQNPELKITSSAELCVDSTLESVNESENQKRSDEQPLEASSLVPESENLNNSDNLVNSKKPWTEGVLLLQEQAIESGSALVLDDSCLDPDVVYKKAVDLAKSAPPGPVFRYERKKLADQNINKKESDSEPEERTKPIREPKLEDKILALKVKSKGTRRDRTVKGTRIREDNVDVGLRVDELAKLLA